jgi:hypothetical protein
MKTCSGAQALIGTENSFLSKNLLRFTCVAIAALFAWASSSRAQQLPNQTQIGITTMGDTLYVKNVDAQAERDQDAAYQAFLKEQEPAKKIQLGNNFLQKYPKSPHVESIDVGLMNAYRAQQAWKDSYRFADNALALSPDDVEVLTTVGWTIPHVYSPSDPDADQELTKAESYAKHALEVLAKIPKPPNLTDAQFAASKAKRSLQAHSALGLVYFRRQNYDDSAKELEQSTKGNSTPDQTDLYVFGIDLENLKRYGEAAEAFRGCAQGAGALQDQCKQGADSAKALAAQSKTK